jgi:capsid protein
MNKPSILETVVLSAALVCIPLITRAALYEDSKFVEGIVKAVSQNTITLTAKSPDGVGEKDVAIEAQDKTTYQDVNLAELKQGDRIRVEYHDNQDLKTADSITKIQP